jgi:hypothetical protein
MVKEKEFDPQSYVASPFAAPEALPASAPVEPTTADDVPAAETDQQETAM